MAGPFKKDLTPIGIHRPGAVVKHKSKGAAPFQAPPSMPMGSNSYGKAPPQPASAADPMMPPMPAGGSRLGGI